MTKRDKLGFLSGASEAYAADSGPESYKDALRDKIDSRIRESYPWLGDFQMSLLESDPDRQFAYGSARLRGYSGGFRVEFPVFYLEGSLLDIPGFILPERKLMLPFDEECYKLIVSTLNNTDDIGKIREKQDISETLVSTLSSTDYAPVSDILKMSSFSRIASFLPRHVLRGYAKQACAKFPELTRDLYAAIAMSKARGRVKQASAERILADKIAAKRSTVTDSPSEMISIVSPVFLSEAEAADQESATETRVIEVANRAFVMPEANNKINALPIPTFEEIAHSLNQDYELLSPVELMEKVISDIKRRPQEGFVTSSPSTNCDYWLIPDLRISNSNDDGYDELLKGSVGYSSSDIRKSRQLSVNNFGGEFLFDEEIGRFAAALPSRLHDRKERGASRVFYSPVSTEKFKYFLSSLSAPLSKKHSIMEAMHTSGCEWIPVRTSAGRVVSLRLAPCDIGSIIHSGIRKEVLSEGRTSVNYYKSGSNDGGASGGQVLPDVKIVYDTATGRMEKIYYRRDSMPSGLSDYSVKDGKDYLILDVSGLTTYDPDKYKLDRASYGIVQLTPVENSGLQGRRIYAARAGGLFFDPENSSDELSDFVSRVFDRKDLDPEFMLNQLGTDRSGRPDLNLPYAELTVYDGGRVAVGMPGRPVPDYPAAVFFSFSGIDDAIRALANIGILPEDLIDMREEAARAAESIKLSSLRSPLRDTGVKLAYALTPSEPGMEQGLTPEAIMEQAVLLMQTIEKNQDEMRADSDMRADLLKAQMELINTKLKDIDDLKQILSAVTSGDGMQGGDQPQPAQTGTEQISQDQPQGADQPPEVIEAMASAALDPAGASAHDLTPEETELLKKAAQGDGAAAEQIGFTDNDYSLFLKLYHSGASENTGGAEGQAQGTGQAQPGQDDSIATLASILSDPATAVQNGLTEDEVQKLIQASQGDAAAASAIGITVEQAQAAAQQAQQPAPDAAQAQPQEGQAPAAATEEQLAEYYDKATKLITAYFEPEKAEELEVTPEDLGYAAIVLRSPSAAMKAGLPGEMVQAISDAYTAITGKSIYRSAEEEFNGPSDKSLSSGNISSAKNVISNSKGFEEYSKPVAQTSALLDLLPKVRTAKLFFKNADAFREMLTIMGEILINMQLNALQYKESMGIDSYQRLLGKIKKIYDDFGSMVIQMYSLDKE